MPLSEFSLIDRFFKRQDHSARFPAELSIGDDCALIKPPPGKRLAISTDTLVEGVHFLPDTSPKSLGHKVLAVNLSDLAAMGATPAWATLAITLPKADDTWLADFASGFFALADRYDLELIGGDTTKGPLAITITIMGLLPNGQALTRSGAQDGDSIYVTGYIGDAGMGLLMAKDGQRPDPNDATLSRYLMPEPRIDIGTGVLPFASACIDVSDGLLADLTHLLKASGVGADVSVDRIPVSPAVQSYMTKHACPDFACRSGDDYELCFTVSPEREAECLKRLSQASVLVTRIGTIESTPGLRLNDANGRLLNWAVEGYEHQWEVSVEA